MDITMERFLLDNLNRSLLIPVKDLYTSRMRGIIFTQLITYLLNKEMIRSSH